MVLDKLLVLADGDVGLAEFLGLWLMNGNNATKAYQKLNPDVSPKTARVLGSRLLTKVDKLALLSSVGLGVSEYLNGFKKGLNAKNVIYASSEGLITDTKQVADNPTREKYHRRLGAILGLEKPGAGGDTTVNINQAIGGWVKERE